MLSGCFQAYLQPPEEKKAPPSIENYYVSEILYIRAHILIVFPEKKRCLCVCCGLLLYVAIAGTLTFVLVKFLKKKAGVSNEIIMIRKDR